MRIILPVAFLALSACNPGSPGNATAPKQPDHALAAQATLKPSMRVVDAQPEVGRCYGETCSWSITKNSAVVREDAGERLIRLTLLGGTSENTDSDPSTARIKWNARPHEVYIFCSKRLPAVITKSDPPPGEKVPAGLQVDVLDFVNGIPGALESSANLFTRTCFPKQDWGDPDFAKRNGLPAFDDEPDVTITTPEEIFGAASQPHP